MKKFQDELECPKCGRDRPDCEYKTETQNTSEHLSWKCTRCGYVWQTEPKNLDDQENDNGLEGRA